MSLPANGWKNKPGTSKRKDGSTMKSLWEKKYKWPQKCSVLGCNESATDGAHMINSGTGSFEEWIVPTCHFHNEQEDTKLTLKDGTIIHKLNDLKN